MIKNEELKTPWKVRLVVGIIGMLMLGSTLAIYFGVFVNYGEQAPSQATPTDMEERLAEITPIVDLYAKNFSSQYFDAVKGLKSEVKGFNEEALTYGVRDLKVGDGRMIESASDPYLAYYIGWKPDESIIDSSFDNYESPTALNMPLPGTVDMIKGWLEGIVGMRLGGVREISIPSDYAYDNGALKFLVMLIPYEGTEFTEISEYNELRMAIAYGQQG